MAADKEEKDPPVALDDAITDPDDRATLVEMCKVARDISEEKAALEKTYRSIMDDIKETASRLGVPRRVIGDGWELRRTVTTRKTIIPERLMERGVALRVIEDSTEVKVTESYGLYGAKAE